MRSSTSKRGIRSTASCYWASINRLAASSRWKQTTIWTFGPTEIRASESGTRGEVGIETGTPSNPLEAGTNGTNGNGAHVTAGGTWTDGSSRNFKDDLRSVDAQQVLQGVVELPLYRWRYKGTDEGEHMGPMAEDFFEAFALGKDERYISGVDGDGVLLAAVQGLYELVQELQDENERMGEALKRAGIE